MNGLEVAKYSVLSGVMMVRVVCSFPVAAMADCHELGGSHRSGDQKSVVSFIGPNIKVTTGLHNLGRLWGRTSPLTLAAPGSC